jgi:hypothetical protein
MEADWGLGRNPLNIIQMTTATTPLENKRSVMNIYTTGRNDGTPGMHPGHTPYLNAYDWGGNMAMGNPSWMTKKSYPSDVSLWPMGEIYFDTRYVYAHSEFTPQQTMRGKMALYGYLHAIVAEDNPEPPEPPTGISENFKRQKNVTNGIQIYPNPASGIVRVVVDPECTKGEAYNLKIYNMTGQLQMNTRNATPETVIDVSHLTTGVYLLSIESKNFNESTKFSVK